MPAIHWYSTTRNRKLVYHREETETERDPHLPTVLMVIERPDMPSCSRRYVAAATTAGMLSKGSPIPMNTAAADTYGSKTY